MVGHASDFIFHFFRTSTEGVQTAELKHKFERLAKDFGVRLKHCHTDKNILNEQIFRESHIAAN